MRALLKTFRIAYPGKSRKTVVALESSGEYLKLAVVSVTPRGRKISKLVARTVVLQEDLSTLLQGIVEDGLIQADSRVVISIPRNLVTVRNLQLPTTDPQELREMVNLQAVKQTPFLKDEIIADYQVVRSSPEGYTDVVLVTTHRSVSNTSLKILDDAGLKAEVIRLSSHGVMSAYKMMKAADDAGKNEPVAIVDIDSNYCDFIVTTNQRICFTKSLSLSPVKLLVGGEQEIDKFSEEIERVFEIYGNEGVGGRISKIVLSGAELEVDRLQAKLREALHVPVERLVVSRCPGISPDVMDAPENANRQVSFSSVLGLAWEPRSAEIDLTPQEVRLRESLAKKGRAITAIGVSVILLLTAVTIFVSQKLYAKRQYLAALREEVAETKREAADVEMMIKKIRLIGKAPGFQNSSLEVLSVLHKTLPPEVYLKSIAFEDASFLILQGVSQKMSSVFGLLSTLEKQPQFHHVKTKHITRSPQKDGQEQIDFEMTCLLTNDGEI